MLYGGEIPLSLGLRRIEEKFSLNSLNANVDKLTSVIFVHELSIEHSTTCDSRTNLNHIIILWYNIYLASLETK